MTVRVLLFGPQAALAGASAVDVTVADAPTPTGLLAALSTQHPSLADSLGASRLAVNHEFADPASAIQPGDEVALIGMVSGG